MKIKDIYSATIYKYLSHIQNVKLVGIYIKKN